MMLDEEIAGPCTSQGQRYAARIRKNLLALCPLEDKWVDEVPLAHKESFKYLGMWFHKHVSITKSSEHVTGPSWHLPDLAVCARACTEGQTACAALVGKSIFGPSWHGTLGVERATPNWAVLRDCGRVPLQFYWFKSAFKLYDGLLNSNFEPQKVLHRPVSDSDRAAFIKSLQDPTHGVIQELEEIL
eukprot:447502-Pelagomonas_calceolata.AAC.1